MDFNAFLNALLNLAPDQVSDLHFKVGAPPTLRINGVMRHAKFNKLAEADTERIVQNFLTDRQKQHLDTLKSLDTSYSTPEGQRFRVNVFRQRGVFSAVLRVIPREIPTVESLGLPPVLKEIAMEERGMVLVTGITGSGKSSTLAAMINHINHNRKGHILTIEDPIEYIYEDNQCTINQREIGPDADSFADALRGGLRQDPDVILVGEMRDRETIEIALKASETGHMVFSTLHTVDAAKTVNRIIDSFPGEQQQQVRYQLSANLKAVISQRLLRRQDEKGRVPAVEIMRSTGTIRACIEEAEKTAGIRDAIEAGRDQYQMQSFDQHLTRLYRDEAVSLETAKAASSNPADFERALQFE